MRINVYSQELTREVKLVSKSDERGTVHWGVRIYFDGSPRLHNRPDDDDRSAITYWIPNHDTSVGDALAAVFFQAAKLVHQAQEKMSR